jgi:hypothetical protein
MDKFANVFNRLKYDTAERRRASMVFNEEITRRGSLLRTLPD